MKTYEINDRIDEIRQRINELYSAHDITEEIELKVEALVAEAFDLQNQFDASADDFVKLIKRVEGEADVHEAEAAALIAPYEAEIRAHKLRAHQKRNAAKRWREMLAFEMKRLGKPKVSGTFTAYITTKQRLEYNEQTLDDRYKTLITQIDKAALRRDVKAAGGSLGSARLVEEETPTLTIK